MAASSKDVARQIDGSWRELQSALAEVPGDRMEEPGVVGHWSTKDLLGHVTTWEAEMMANVQRVVDGLEMKPYPDLDAFNADASAAKRTMSVEDLRQELSKVHEETVRFVSALSDELLGREKVEWRIRIDTFAHYREHAEQVRRWLAPEPRPSRAEPD
jgi:hypothetical protein